MVSRRDDRTVISGRVAPDLRRGQVGASAGTGVRRPLSDGIATGKGRQDGIDHDLVD